MSKGPGGQPMNLPPGMLAMIGQLLQSGQWGTPQGFEKLLGGPSPTSGPGGFTAGRNRYMREHPQDDPFGWSDFLEGKSYDPNGKPRPLTLDELSAQRNYASQGGFNGWDPYSAADPATSNYGPGSGPPKAIMPFKSNIEGYSKGLSEADIAAIKGIDPTLRGNALLNALPEGFNTDYYKVLAQTDLSLNKWPGISGAGQAKTEPMSRDEAQLAAAMGLGYGMKGGMQQRRGDLGVIDRVNVANARQSLEQAGWDPSMGYGPQANLSDKMNQLLFAISPDYDKSKIPEPKKDPRLSQVYDPFGGMQSAINRDAYVNDTLGGGFYGGVLPEKDDQSWTVHDTIRRGGGRGLMTDPHYATPQMDASGKPDLYAGWASNQAQQFGQLPYDLFGMQVNDINHPENQSAGFMAGNMVKNTAPPTWNGGNATPWPTSTGNKPAWGTNSTWGQGGGPVGSPAGAASAYGGGGPSFGASPWGNSAWNNSWGANPWGMQ